MNFKHFFYLLAPLVLFSCSGDPLNVSVEEKDLGIRFVNLDSIFVSSSEQGLKAAVDKQKLMPGQVLDYELGHCLQVGMLSDSGTAQRIKKFVNDPYISRVEKRIEEKFATISQIHTKIRDGFLHLNHHFPKGKIPRNVVFMNSLFASNVFCTENEIGIGMERYLGPKTDVVQELPSQEFFEWIKEGMRIEYLERDVLTAWIMTHYVKESKQNIADALITWGKIIYLTEAAFPDEEKHLVMRYSKEDYEWALKNEYALWKYLVDEKLLFSENERDMANLVNDAPFTIGLPEKGPDRLGQFLGWQMIHDYMEKHPETSLEKLLKIPYNTILQEYEVE
ncbi:MAG: hypothetical protein K0R65_2116 [Crocinitomicaceae bacterium]|jgi:hypothetical protein|nr:hypothetical protein [Crocinitomicaceae bacterium]